MALRLSLCCFLYLALVFSLSSCSYLYYSEKFQLTSACSGSLNTMPPYTGAPVKIKTVANGSLYVVGEGDDQIYLLHVYGSAYDMGYAHGQLLRSQIQDVLPKFMAHVEKEFETYIKFLPQKVQSAIADIGLNAALEMTYQLTKKYTAKYFYDEIKGMSDGAGIEYSLAVRVHMLPELVKAGCSMLGAWGDAVNSGFVQLRALDWDVNGPLQNAPTVVIYHPDNGHPYANVGWSGWLATISGMSSKGLAVSEKHSDEPFGEESRSGIPFNFLMKDILQFDSTLENSIRRIQNAHRTCSIWLGVGDAKEKRFRMFEYSYSTDTVLDDMNVTSIDISRYTREGCDDTCYKNYTLKDLVYWGVHLGCWNSVLHANYGKLSPESVMQLVGLVRTGNLHAVVYDLEKTVMFVANAKGSGESGPLNAYDRQFVQFDLASLFNEPRPL